MNQYHLLTEAEIDAKKNELLSQLSDEDLAMIVGELDEAEDGRFGFDPLKRSQPTQNKPVTSPAVKQEPKPQPKKVEPARKAEIKQTVDQLKPKEKAALVKAAKAELKKREASPKDVKPAQPGTLKKVVKNLALAAVAATVIGGMFSGGNDAPSGADSTPQATAVAQADQQAAPVTNWKKQKYAGDGIDSSEKNLYYVTSKNSVDLGFPYRTTTMDLNIRMLPNGKLDPNGGIYLTSKGQFYHPYSSSYSDGYDGKFKIKIDDNPVEEIQYINANDASSGVAFVKFDDRLLKKLAGSKTVKIKIQYFQGGEQVFTFDTSGLENALNNKQSEK